MGDKIVIDTDILIDFLRNKEYAIELFWKFNEKGTIIATTDINVSELYYGAYKSEKQDKNLASVKGFLNTILTLSTDEDSMEMAGKIAIDLEQKGQKIEIRDLIIGAIALVNGFNVITNNTEHFKRIEGLNILKGK